jgi:hypothetical protein
VETDIGGNWNDTLLVEIGIGGKGKGLLLVKTGIACIERKNKILKALCATYRHNYYIDKYRNIIHYRFLETSKLSISR